MLTAKTVSDFKIRKSKAGKLSVFYKEKQFIVISEKVLFQIILQTSPTWFLKSLTDLADRPDVKIDSGLIKFASVYAFEKLKYYKKDVSSISDVSVLDSAKKMLKDKKTVSSFNEAIRLMREAGAKDISDFIKAQIAGLGFVNGGRGTFPNPSQLSTDNALTRLLQFNSSTKKDEKEIKPEKYWYYDDRLDGDVSLKNNTKYQEALKKIKDKTAPLNAVLYAKKCYSKRRNGQSYFLIEDYLLEISV